MPGRNGKRKATDDMPDRKGKRKATDDGQQVARRKAPRVRDLPQSNIICFRANPNAPGPSRAPLSVERKQQVKEVRDLGACMRCAWLRKPCSGGDPCIPCLELAALKNNATCLSWMPCYRLNLTEHFEHFLLRWSMHVSELNISVDASMLIPFFKLEEFSSINLNDLLSTFWGLCSSSGYSREAYWISEIPWDEIPDDAAELISRPGLESCGSKPVYSTYFNVITPVGSCMHLLRRLEKMLMPRQLAKLSHTQLQDVFHLLVYSATAYAMNMRQSQHKPSLCDSTTLTGLICQALHIGQRCNVVPQIDQKLMRRCVAGLAYFLCGSGGNWYKTPTTPVNDPRADSLTLSSTPEDILAAEDEEILFEESPFSQSSSNMDLPPASADPYFRGDVDEADPWLTSSNSRQNQPESTTMLAAGDYRQQVGDPLFSEWLHNMDFEIPTLEDPNLGSNSNEADPWLTLSNSRQNQPEPTTMLATEDYGQQVDDSLFSEWLRNTDFEIPTLEDPNLGSNSNETDPWLTLSNSRQNQPETTTMLAVGDCERQVRDLVYSKWLHNTGFEIYTPEDPNVGRNLIEVDSRPFNHSPQDKLELPPRLYPIRQFTHCPACGPQLVCDPMWMQVPSGFDCDA